MKISILFLFVLLTSALAAQPDPDEMDSNRKEKIEALKRAYISEKLDLTVAEAEKFWPIYNEFSDAREVIRKEQRMARKKLKAGTPNEKDAVVAIDLMAQKRKEEADLDAKFLKDCLPVLGVEKVMNLANLEREFQKELMQKIKERRQENQGGPRPGGGPGKGPGRRN